MNKVSTKVELLFNVGNSVFLSEDQKVAIHNTLKNRISKEGMLSLQCDETRSQAKNKEIVFDRFVALIEVALKPVKKRRPSKPTKASIQKRLTLKKQKAEKKSSRKKKTDD